jgi:hypothetical protein
MKKTIIDVIKMVALTIAIIGCVIFGANMFMEKLEDDLNTCLQIQSMLDLDEAGVINIKTSITSYHGLFDTEYDCMYVDNQDNVHIVKMVANSYIFDKFFADEDI